MDRIRKHEKKWRRRNHDRCASPTGLLFFFFVFLQIIGHSKAETLKGKLQLMNDGWLNLARRLNPLYWRQKIDISPTALSQEGEGTFGIPSKRVSNLEDDRFKEDLGEENREFLPEAFPWIQTGMGLFQRWGKVIASGAQLAIIAYLAHAVWTAALEVIEEYKEEAYAVDSSVFSRDHVLEAIHFLEQPRTESEAQLDRALAERNTRSLPHMPTLQIAQKLALAGLPLRSDGEQNLPKPSVESLLLSLSRSEVSLLQQCLWVPSTNKKETWNDIVGLDRVKKSLLSMANSIATSDSLPAYESLFEHSSSYIGVLLWGPPGCGKSFLIKGLAAESGIPCLVVSPSVLLRKYVGETNQQCRSLFSLARKLAPCILCIDEVDGLFKERNEWEHEVSRDLKTEFLQHLDGMMDTTQMNTRGSQRRNLVVAATNRPFDVDTAVLRRLTQSYYVSLPGFADRTSMLKRMLKSVPVDPNMDISFLASKTEGYSPSDLRHLLQTAAASGPLQESVTHPPPLKTQHVLQATKSVSPVPLSTNYRWALSKFAQAQDPTFMSIPRDAQNTDQHNLAVDGDSSFAATRWETDYGNFYHLGNLQIDPTTFEKLADLVQSLVEFEKDSDSDDEDFDL